MKKSDTFRGTLLTLAAGCLWSLSGSCGQYIFTYKSVTSNWLVPIRLTVGGAILVAILFAKSGKKALSVWKGGKNARDMLIFALFGMMMCQYSYFTAIEHSNAGTATVLQYLGPAMVMVIMCIMERRLPKLSEMAAVVLAIGGTLLLATHGDMTNLAISPLALMWGLIAAVMLVMSTVPPARIISEFGSMAITGWGMLVGGVILMAVFRPWTIAVNFDGGCALALTVIIAATILAYTFYLEGIKLVGPAKASILACIEPVSAAVISALWLKTTFVPLDILGFAMIISTIFILNFRPKRTGR